MDIVQFTIEPAKLREQKKLAEACYPFYNTTRFFFIDKISLPAGLGKYVFKVLVRTTDNKQDDTIQTMTMIKVCPFEEYQEMLDETNKESVDE